MDLSTTNRLILEHLRFYGYQLAARILESEFKGKQPKEQTTTSRLFETLQKFVELYGKPDLWNTKNETSSQEELESMKVNLPRMNNSPFRGVQGHNTGPFQRGNHTQEAYKVAAHSTSPFHDSKNKSLRPPIMGNTAPVTGANQSRQIQNRDHSNTSSHMSFVANALKNREVMNNEKNNVGIVRAASYLHKANSSFDVDPQNSESLHSTEGDLRNDSFSAKKALQNFRAYQTNDPRNSQKTSGYLDTVPNEPRNSNHWNEENFNRTKQGRSVSVQPIGHPNGKGRIDRSNTRHNESFIQSSDDLSSEPSQTQAENYFGRTKNSAWQAPPRNSEYRVNTNTRPPQSSSLLQDYNAFLQQKTTNSGVDKNITHNVPPTFRIESQKPSRDVSPSFIKPQQNKSFYQESENNISFQQQQPFQKQITVNPESHQPINRPNLLQQSPNFSDRKFGKQLSIIEERNSDQYLVLEALEAEKNLHKKQTTNPTLNVPHNTISYLKENTLFSEIEIRKFHAEFNDICEMSSSDPYLEKNKFSQFIKRTKNITSNSFVDCLFTFGSQMGILNGNPPRIGFEESLIVLSQLSQKNPIELIRFLFMIGSGGRREIQLAVLEQILKELAASENKEIIKILFKCIEHVCHNSHIPKEQLISLDNFWDVAKNFEGIQQYF